MLCSCTRMATMGVKGSLCGAAFRVWWPCSIYLRPNVYVDHEGFFHIGPWLSVRAILPIHTCVLQDTASTED